MNETSVVQPDDIAVCVSYWPLLQAQAGSTMPFSKASVESLLRSIVIPDICGCAWISTDHGPEPILIIERKAKQITEHLLNWCDHKPSDWFSLHLVRHRRSYALAVWPDIEKSIRRFRVAYLVKNEKLLPPSITIHVIFKPLSFISGANPDCLELFDQLGAETRVGLTDAVNQNIDIERINHIGTLKIVHQSQLLEQFLGLSDNGQDMPDDDQNMQSH